MRAMTTVHAWDDFSLEALPALAQQMAEALPMTGVVAVHGPMGAGKTTLIRALLQAWEVEEPAASPTFGLVHHHQVTRNGRSTEVRHMDLYRLADEEEAERSGIADMLHDPVLTLVEWPERIPGLMPDDAWMVRLVPVDGGGRSCILSHL